MASEVSSAQNGECARCGKPAPLCVCADIAPIDNRVEIVVLQHPQEQDAALGTARLTLLHFRRASLKIGLSWPSLAKVLGRSAEPRRWAVLYLGSAKPAELAPGREVVLVDRKGKPLADQDRLLGELEGVVILDGSWSQAKALWWRNPWMLKCRRAVLAPRFPSHYGKLRREPRREGLSTIEAAGLLVSRLEGKPEIERALLSSFDRLLGRYRAARRAAAQQASASSNGPSSAA